MTSHSTFRRQLKTHFYNLAFFLATVAWAFGITGRRRCLRPYGGICVLQSCSRTCFTFFNTSFLRYGHQLWTQYSVIITKDLYTFNNVFLSVDKCSVNDAYKFICNCRLGWLEGLSEWFRYNYAQIVFFDYDISFELNVCVGGINK